MKVKKIFVLAGGSDQAAFISYLRERFDSVEIILIDFAERVLASNYADRHLVISTLDEDAVLEAARNENIDLILTACGDQTLPTMTYVSEKLGLPCYLTYEQSINLTNKLYMKRLMIKNNIPTSKFILLENSNIDSDLQNFSYPLVVKPVDNNGSKGIIKVFKSEELKKAIEEAISFSKTKDVIIEEFREGPEFSIEAFIKEDGEPEILIETELIKIRENTDKFTILQCNYPCFFSDKVRSDIKTIIKKIGLVFNIKNAPFMIQLIVKDESVNVIEFSARTGGGSKYYMLKKLSGINIFENLIDITLGVKPNIIVSPLNVYASLNYVYTNPGVFCGLVNFDYLKYQKIIDEYFFYKQIGGVIQNAETSSQRPVGFFILDISKKKLTEKLLCVNGHVKVLSENKDDMMKHNLYN